MLLDQLLEGERLLQVETSRQAQDPAIVVHVGHALTVDVEAVDAQLALPGHESLLGSDGFVIVVLQNVVLGGGMRPGPAQAPPPQFLQDAERKRTLRAAVKQQVVV